MASEEPQPQDGSSSTEKLVERAKWFKDDSDTGKGWTQRYHVIDEYNSWSKTFPEEEVKVKILFKFKNLPMPAEKFAEMVHPENMETRKKWDKAFKDLEILETLSDGSVVCSLVVQLSFPLTNREMVTKFLPPVEIDWFGKKAYAIFVENAAHASKPLGVPGLVRATNGGNFYIAVPDDEEPGAKCEVFGLTNNNYNGRVPDKNEWMAGQKVSKVFYQMRDSLNEGYQKYFS